MRGITPPGRTRSSRIAFRARLRPSLRPISCPRTSSRASMRCPCVFAGSRDERDLIESSTDTRSSTFRACIRSTENDSRSRERPSNETCTCPSDHRSTARVSTFRGHRLEPLRRHRGAGPEPALDIMLRRLKKFTVYSSVIVAGQASRALDDAPFAGQDESKDAEGLLRLLSECEASFVQIFGECIDPDATKLRVHPASPTPGALRNAPRRRRDLRRNQIIGPIPTEIGQLTALTYLRVPPASPTPGAPRDLTLGVAGTAGSTRSPARSRPRSASSRR